MSIVGINTYVGDSLVRWEAYKHSDNIISRFSSEEWHKIASDVDREEDLDSLFTHYPDRIQGFVLYENKTSSAIAFVYLLNESKKDKVVSFHGGGWGKSPRLSLLYMRGAILLIEHILKAGIKVRTYCALDNANAYKFMHGLGFVRYRTTDERIYQWVNLHRLHNSKIYKYIFKKDF